MSTTIINYQPWLQAVLNIARHYRIEPSEERIRLQLDWNQHHDIDDMLKIVSRQMGLNVRKNKFERSLLNPWCLPLLVEFDSGDVGVIERIDTQGNVSIQLSGDEGLSQSFTIEQLEVGIKHLYVLRPESSVPDARVDEYIKPFEKNWFWSIVLNDWKRYIDVMFASLIANILALATIVFSMNVYDRVIPSQSIPTLWVLAGGVLIAAIFEFGWCFKKYAGVNKSVIKVKESQIKGFKMIFELFRKVATSPKSTPDSMTNSTIVTFNTDGKNLPITCLQH